MLTSLNHAQGAIQTQCQIDSAIGQELELSKIAAYQSDGVWIDLQFLTFILNAGEHRRTEIDANDPPTALGEWNEGASCSASEIDRDRNATRQLRFYPGSGLEHQAAVEIQQWMAIVKSIVGGSDTLLLSIIPCAA